ncbi:MarR family winged helix-turn-helix transcriptional regulator [Ideonella sp. DXS29W]|uniref:MarR family winged helix-turn-helix transcriptional regulator n=1 Tax=Ideonella lacteola TaxID=2984193 RepID=A0ABU9BZ46_9BURK
MSESAMAGELLREVARLYVRAQRAVADCCQTTSTQCHILTELARSGPMAMGELGSRLLLEKSWISRAIDSLVALDLVSKAPNPADARSWIVSLTTAGKRRVKSLNTSLDQHAEHLLDGLSDRDRQQVRQALIVLLRQLRSDPNARGPLPITDRQEASPCR